MNPEPTLYAVTVKGMGGAVKFIIQNTSERQIMRDFTAIGIRVCINNITSFAAPPSEREGCTPMQPSLFNE